MNFIAELRKRNVFRVLAAYLVGAWIMVQVIGFVADAAELPAWIDSFVLIVVLLGLPIVAVAAWALELTPDGIKASGTETEVAPRPLGPVDYVLMAAVVVVVGLFGWQMIASPRAPAEQAAPEEIVADAAVARSIAVMPFVAISSTPEDIVLGDGLSEELLNVLAQFADLQVAGRTSSFSFRDQAEDIQGIGAALGVAHVLEGSVRRSDDQIRVTAQLIRVSDGFHIWSGTYDRPFADILQVQDDIVRRIAQVLTIRLGASSYDLSATSATNPAAYDQYLQGRVQWAQRQDVENRYGAIDAFQTAVDIDPGFADAWAGLARAIFYSNPPDGYSLDEHWERGKDAVDHALALDPDNAEALVALANWHLNASRDWMAAQAATERALELAPSAAYTHYGAAFTYEIIGNMDLMTRAMRRTLSLDPLNVTIQGNVINRYVRAGRYADARRILAAASFDPITRLQQEAGIAINERDADEMERAFAEALPLMIAADPQFEAVRTEVEALIAGYAAAMRGDRDRVYELMPIIEAAATEEGPLSLSDPAFVLYLLGDYEEAARRLRSIYESGAENANFDVVTTIETRDVGFRCQADYHAIWELPGYPELAEIRRANGATSNLPLEGEACEGL